MAGINIDLTYGYLVATLFVNYHRYDLFQDIIKGSLDYPENFPSPSPLLLHHFTMALANFAALMLVTFGQIISVYGLQSMFCLNAGLYGAICMTIQMMFVLTMLLPELILLRFVQCLGHQIAKALENFDKFVIDQTTFLQEIQQCYKLFKKIGEVFGANIVVLFGIYLIQLIFSVYFTIAFLVGDFPMFSSTVKYVFSVTWLFYAIICIKRTMHVTSYTQKLLNSVNKTVERLIIMEAKTEPGPTRQQIHLAKNLLLRIDGLPAHGFFKVDRSILPSLLGHFLTYFIILVEFKLNELSRTHQ